MIPNSQSVIFEFQPRLQNVTIGLVPLQATDFEPLFQVASDPLIWEQHPNRNRYQREVFQTFFQGAIESGAACAVYDRSGDELVGCSRFYQLNPVQRSVSIGYTFLARRTWGKHYNQALKQLMIDHAFRFVTRVTFEIGLDNLRSRKAIEKIGGIQIGEAAIAYYGEQANPNAIYKIDKGDWVSAR